jgi:hypothetical protein
MIKVIIDGNGKSELHVEGRSGDCLRESCIGLIEICETLSEATGDTFDNIFETVVHTAKVLKFFKDKEQEHEDRT